MRYALILAAMIVFSVGSTANAQLLFNFDAADGTPQEVIDGFNEAASLWQAHLHDSVTVNVKIDFSNFNPVLAETAPTAGAEAYSVFKNFLGNDVTSAADASAFSSLQAGSSFNALINLTSDNPNGNGSSTSYLTNRNMVQASTANFKALGVLPGDWMGGDPMNPVYDGSISFNPDPGGNGWDFDRSDMIQDGKYDFVGAAAHELGHVLGFYSQVDAIDQFGFFHELLPDFFDVLTADEYTSVSIDLFRYSAASLAVGTGVEDMTANTDAKYFSIDGGVTSLAEFSTGTYYGNTRQAGHWENGVIGLMGPQALPGMQLSDISAFDLLALDVIGWDLIGVPEPGSSSILLLGIAGIAALRRKRGIR